MINYALAIAATFAGSTGTKFHSQVYLHAHIRIHKFRMPPLLHPPHTNMYIHIHSYHKPQVEDYRDYYAPRRRRGDQYEILAGTPTTSRSEYGSV